MFKNHYEMQLEMMMDREVEVKGDLKNAFHKNSMLQNRIDLDARKMAEYRDVIQTREDAIEEINIKVQVLTDEIKGKEREIYLKEKNLQEVKNSIASREKVLMKRLKDLEGLKTQLKGQGSELDAMTKHRDELQEKVNELTATKGDL